MTFKSLYITDEMRHNIYLKQDFTCGTYFSMMILSPCFKKTYENYAFSEVHQWLFYIVSSSIIEIKFQMNSMTEAKLMITSIYICITATEEKSFIFSIVTLSN